MNNEDQLQNLIKESGLTKLTNEEKNAVRENLLRFIEANPLPVREENFFRLIIKRSTITPLTLIKDMAIALIVVILVAGGTTLAAERALPGDLLYPVKIGINEEVGAALSASTEAKANWEVRRLERRLEEAEKLAENNKLDEATQAKIETSVEKHSQKINNLKTKTEARGEAKAAVEINANLEAKLKTHREIFLRLATEKENLSFQLNTLIDKINKAETKTGAEAEIKNGEGQPQPKPAEPQESEIKLDINEETELKLDL